jgi:hypothetical protein
MNLTEKQKDFIAWCVSSVLRAYLDKLFPEYDGRDYEGWG